MGQLKVKGLRTCDLWSRLQGVGSYLASLSACFQNCMHMQAEERAEKEAQRQMEKDAKNREREEAKKMARYPIEDSEVSNCQINSVCLWTIGSCTEVCA